MFPDKEDVIVFQQDIARLQALLEASRQVHSGLALDAVLHCALEIAVKELELEGAYFTESEALETATQRSYGVIPEELTDHHPSVLLRDGQGRVLTEMVAVRRGLPLSMEERDFLEGLALQSAVAVENARNHERMLAWERVQQDLHSARAIQRSLLPHELPEIAGYRLGFRSQTCYEVGGDYLDILPLGANRFVMVVADVAGKGMASAMVSVSFRAAFRAMAGSGMALGEVAERMNELHYSEGLEARRRYVTAILMRLDTERHEMEVVNAGHNPGFFLDGAGGQVLLEASGPPLGMLPGRSYEVERMAFGPGARLMFYTDGLTEVFQGEDEFGMDRLLESFAGRGALESSAVLDGIWSELNAFSDGSEQTDDMTALVLLRGGGPEA